MNDSQLSVLVASGFAELGLVDQLPMVKWVGATGVQIWPNYEAPIDPPLVRRQVEDAGLALRSVHLPFGPGYDISAPEEKERDAAVAALTAKLDLVVEVGAAFSVLHPAYRPTTEMKRQEREARLRCVGESLERLGPQAEARGLQLALENMPPNLTGDQIGDLLAIIEAANSRAVGVCFDTGHANMVGRPLRMWQEALPHILCIHAHDNDGREDRHFEPFAGTLDWTALRRALGEANYRADFTLECLSPLVMLYRRGDAAWRDRFRRWWSGAGRA